MQSHIKLGRVRGISIGLHFSWVVIAVLIAVSLASQFHYTNPGWSDGLVWTVSIVTAVLFFAAIVAHELSHALVATSRGLPVRSITLFALGGVAQIERDAGNAKTEFWMALAGPAMSFAIGFICLAVASAVGWSRGTAPGTPFTAVLVWLGYINLALGAFNLIPGFPLDGGRVLRALIWWANGNADRSTRIAARIGQVVAVLFIAWGFSRFLLGGNFGSLWLAIIGWFLFDAAAASYAQVETVAELRGVRVADIMARDCSVVDARGSLQAFVDDWLLRTARRCFIVQDGGHIVGLITPSEVAKVGRAEWSSTTIRQVMLPIEGLHTIAADTPAAEGLEIMAREDVNQLPVVSEGRIAGVLSRGQVLRWLRMKSRLPA